MSEEMLNAMDSLKEVKVGDVVTGEVLSIDDNKQVIVSIVGAGVEGVIPLKELSTTPVESAVDVVSIGEEIELVVISEIGKDKENGSYLLSKRRIESKKVWADIEKKYQAGELLEGTVTDVVKGGIVIDVGVRGFIPGSMVSNQFIKDFSDFKGQVLKCKIMEIEPSENKLVLSHRVVLEEEAKQAKEAIFSKIIAGDIVQGVVARLTNFGAFIDLGGVDGLVHVSELSHAHVSNPGEVLSVGDHVSAKVLTVDSEKGRIGLSIKETLEGPWSNISSKIEVGSVIEGVVKRLTTFGAFVEVLPGVEGLVHISQISHERIATPHEKLSEGDVVKVKVLDVAEESRRLGLSIKALEVKETPEFEKIEEEYVLPEEETGFTLGEVLGKDLLK